MTYSAKIVADSVTLDGARLTTMLVTLPRIVLAEYNTHRNMSRNSASSRAIPVPKMIASVKNNPFIPTYWGKNQKGMQADAELTPEECAQATRIWLEGRDKAVEQVEKMVSLGVHKQLANRMLEPWMWTTVLASATTWHNFFHLRCSPHAQPEIRIPAELMREALQINSPRLVEDGDWHLPFLQPEDVGADLETLKKVTTARCARTSYLTHEGKRDLIEDVGLHDSLATNKHWSPFEHIATPCSGRHGNFTGWKQYRQFVDHAPY